MTDKNRDTLSPKDMTFLIERGFDFDRALTTQGVIDLLPKFIIDGDKDYFPTIAIDNGGYVYMYCTNHMQEILVSTGYSDSLIQAAFSMVKWCLGKNLINR